MSPSAPAQAPSHRTPWARIVFMGALPLVVTLWLSVPAFQPQPIELRGAATRSQACLWFWCADVLQVGSTKLACQADLIGVPYSCRSKLLQSGDAVVRYAPLPSLAGWLGLAPTEGLLLRLERDGQLVSSRSLHQQVWQALYGGWVFHMVYWPLVGFLAWRWPRSAWVQRIWQRATWSDPR
jgi:hypothetical protein